MVLITVDEAFLHPARERASFEDIDQGIIWKQFDEPRIHFAVNCVAIGCPLLGTEAYGASQLDAQPEDNTRVFMRNERRTCTRAGPDVVRTARLV